MNDLLIDRLKADIRLLVVLALQPSFAELSRIPGFKGHEHCAPLENNIVLWPSCSHEAVIAVEELLRDEEIIAICCDIATYVYEPVAIPDLPVALKLGIYESPVWLPVYFVVGRIIRPDECAGYPTKDWISANLGLQ